ncbi:MAG TPA: pantetheine-phosphate adenylyltransferase [Candidatus Omnitrophota bacterium]|nr:pantetheine-phosphate adenylyltransferase [Candidatus Omnitrophota bacterium]HPN89127.1 pantetheine-phosphate adenylyltransferase [Candidatus Omnitrophota bacterium]
MSRTAIYPGTFDPLTYGHLDVIKRACHIFDKVIVAVAKTSRKKLLFDCEERVAMIKETTKGIKNLKIEAFDGLIIKYAKKNNVNILIRGLRMISDFENELQMALTNRRLDGNIETIFLMPSEGYSFLSSTLIKEALQLGADMASFVPKIVEKKLKEKLGVKK